MSGILSSSMSPTATKSARKSDWGPLGKGPFRLKETWALAIEDPSASTAPRQAMTAHRCANATLLHLATAFAMLSPLFRKICSLYTSSSAEVKENFVYSLSPANGTHYLQFPTDSITTSPIHPL